MAKSRSALLTDSSIIKSETVPSANTAGRVGTMFEDIVKSFLQGYDPTIPYGVGEYVLWNDQIHRSLAVDPAQPTVGPAIGENPTLAPLKWKRIAISLDDAALIGNIINRPIRVRGGVSLADPGILSNTGGALFDLHYFVGNSNGLPIYDHALASQAVVKAALRNQAPLPPTIPDQQATEGIAFNFTLPQFTDLESGSQNLKYEVTNLPAGLSFSKATNTISGTPTTPGTYSAVYTATDPDGAYTPYSFKIVVAPKPVNATIRKVLAYYDPTYNAIVVLADGDGNHEVITANQTTPAKFTDTSAHPMAVGNFVWGTVPYNRRYAYAPVQAPVAGGETYNITVQTVGGTISVQANYTITPAFSEKLLFPTANILLNKTAAQSTTVGTNTANLSNDGNLATLASTQGEPGSWWEADAGGAFNMDSLTVRNRTDNSTAQARLDGAYVYISNISHVGDSSTALNFIEKCVYWTRLVGTTIGTLPITLPSLKQGRYVGLIQPANVPLHVVEMEATGVPIVDPISYLGGLGEETLVEGTAYSRDLTGIFTGPVGMGLTVQEKNSSGNWVALYSGLAFDGVSEILSDSALDFSGLDDTATSKKKVLKVTAATATQSLSQEHVIRVTRTNTSTSISRAGHIYDGAGLFLVAQSGGLVRGRIKQRTDGVYSGSTSFQPFTDYNSTTGDGATFNKRSPYIANVPGGVYEVEWDSGEGTALVAQTINLTSSAGYSKQDYPAISGNGSISAFNVDRNRLTTDRKTTYRATASAAVQFVKFYTATTPPESDWKDAPLVNGQYVLVDNDLLTPTLYTFQARLKAEPSVKQTVTERIDLTTIVAIDWQWIKNNPPSVLNVLRLYIKTSFPNGAQASFQSSGGGQASSFDNANSLSNDPSAYQYVIELDNANTGITYAVRVRPTEQGAGIPSREVTVSILIPADAAARQTIYNATSPGGGGGSTVTANTFVSPSSNSDRLNLSRTWVTIGGQPWAKINQAANPSVQHGGDHHYYYASGKLLATDSFPNDYYLPPDTVIEVIYGQGPRVDITPDGLVNKATQLIYIGKANS